MPELEILVCKSHKRRGRDGWGFPKAVRDLLVNQTEGGTVLHLFGGRADFGTRLDIDPATSPHVVGDAWVPPFTKDSFDFVIMDPPYIEGFRTMSNQKTRTLFAAAAWIARKQVIWFHTVWIASSTRCTLHRGYLVVVGRHCHVRCLQFFDVPVSDRKVPQVKHFTRGPAIKYNRWLHQPQGLPLVFEDTDLAHLSGASLTSVTPSVAATRVEAT